MAQQKNRGAGFEWVRNDSGGPPPFMQLTVDTNISIAVGDALTVEADGYADLASSGEDLIGFAVEAVTGAAGTRPTILAVAASAGAVFTGSSQSTQDTQQTDIGEQVDIVGATGAQYLKVADTTGGSCLIIARDPISTAWGSGVQLLFKVTGSQYHGAV